jgi:hypothetical protein
MAVGPRPPTGYIIHDSKWAQLLQRLEDSHCGLKFTFRAQGSDNWTELSSELVEHFEDHGIQVPAHEDDEQDIRFILCSHRHGKAPQSRGRGQEHRLSREERATVDEWSLKNLLARTSDLRYRGLPVLILGVC